VTGIDFGQFRLAFGSVPGDPNYVAHLDFDGGGVSGIDFGQFRIRFGLQVPQ